MWVGSVRLTRVPPPVPRVMPCAEPPRVAVNVPLGSVFRSVYGRCSSVHLGWLDVYARNGVGVDQPACWAGMPASQVLNSTTLAQDVGADILWYVVPAGGAWYKVGKAAAAAAAWHPAAWPAPLLRPGQGRCTCANGVAWGWGLMRGWHVTRQQAQASPRARPALNVGVHLGAVCQGWHRQQVHGDAPERCAR